MDSPEILLLKANTDHLQEYQKIATDTFYESFAGVNSESDMKTYIDNAFSAQKLNTELQNPDSEIYLAKTGGRVIGYLKINFTEAQTDLKDQDALEIERIYVRSEYHGKNIALQLFSKAKMIAEKSGVSYIWLGVWEKNSRAIRFYEKNGFIPFGTHSFMLGKDEQTDLLMKLQLK